MRRGTPEALANQLQCELKLLGGESNHTVRDEKGAQGVGNGMEKEGQMVGSERACGHVLSFLSSTYKVMERVGERAMWCENGDSNHAV